METGREEAHELLDAAEAHGINFLDTANVCGNPNGTAERYIGEWLAERDREGYVLASKVYFPWNEEDPNGGGLSRKHVRAEVEEGRVHYLGASTMAAWKLMKALGVGDTEGWSASR